MSMSITIHLAWTADNGILGHLERHNAILHQKSEAWTTHLGNSVDAAHSKLSQYYTDTGGAKGLLYNLASILDPGKRLKPYKSPDFAADQASIYEAEFRAFYNEYYASYERQDSVTQQGAAASVQDVIDLAYAEKHAGVSFNTSRSDLDDYLGSNPRPEREILSFWKQLEKISPGLAQMAKDVFSAAIAGVGVERVFSIVRQICTYQRNRLDEDTIQQLAIVRYYTKLYSAQQHAGQKNFERQKKRMGYGKTDFQFAEQLNISNEEGDTGAGEAMANDTEGSSGRPKRKRAWHH